jgi:hypothetical protein
MDDTQRNEILDLIAESVTLQAERSMCGTYTEVSLIINDRVIETVEVGNADNG